MTDTQTDTDPRSAPGVPPWADQDGAPWWAGLAGHRIVVQACDACSRRRFPPMPSCPHCGAVGSEPAELAGTGRVYSKVRVDRGLSPGRVDDVPYTIAAVDLDGDVRVFARVDVDAAIDEPVRAAFVDHDGWTELRFEVAR